MENNITTFEAIFKNAPIGIAFVNLQGQVIRSNNFLQKLLGYNEDELLEMNFAQFTHSDDINNSLELYGLLIDGERDHYNIQKKYICKEGQEIFVDLTVSLIRDENKLPLHIIKMIKDITQQKQIEQTKEDANQFHVLFSSAVDYITIINEDSTILNINKVEEGYKLKDVIGANWRGFIAEDIVNDYDEAHKKVFKCKEPAQFNSEVETPVGLMYFSTNITPVFKENKVTKAILITRNITELKNIQKNLADNIDKLQKSNIELKHFAYIASHDLQEPLRVVTGYLQLLTKKYSSQLNKDAFKYIEGATGAAKRMKALINDLLSYSRMDVNEVFKKVQVNEAVEYALKDLKIYIKENKAKVKITTDLPTILGNQIQMKQLFHNLISNAIKFKKEDVDPIVQIDCKSINNHYEFSVADNGIGIDKAYFEKIFVVFQRLHTYERYEGTGIGLALCKRIVEGHQGKIWLTSEIEKGTTFYFTIPHNKIEKP